MTNIDDGEITDQPVKRAAARVVMYVILSVTAVVCSIAALLSALGGDFISCVCWIMGVTVSICVAAWLRA